MASAQYATVQYGHATQPQKEWPLGFCECLTYKNEKGECTCFPFFVPMVSR
jgi:hypothetical protein